MKSVFISSTYIDLQSHRKAVAKILREGKFSPVDMADFGARPAEPKAVCFREIHDSDIFVGIYAYRYGFIPENEARSITESEFHYAKKLDKPMLCYVVDTDYPWPPKFIDDGKARESLNKFKAYIDKKFVRNTFTTPDDLSAKVMADVARELDRDHAGQRLITDLNTTEDVLGILGVDPNQLFAAQANRLRIEESIKKKRNIRAGELRSWLLHGGLDRFKKPVNVTIYGVLQPYVLMHNGWWESEIKDNKSQVRGLREWLLFGLQEWAPSWGYAWDISERDSGLQRMFHLGQIADDMCDEAESIPVYLPVEKAVKLSAEFQENPGGLRVELTGIVAHRSHFCPKSKKSGQTDPCNKCDQQPECLADKRFGGTLDFCLVVDAGEPSHGVMVNGPAEFYSGYLWKCLVPKSTGDVSQARLKDSFFVWEHTNFADPDALAFNLDSLDRKQVYLENRYGPMHLVQKSSALVPGVPVLSYDDFYKRLIGKRI